MAKQKSRGELEVELRYVKRDKWITVVGSNINALIRAIKWIAVAYCIYLSIDSLAGKATDANILLKFLADITTERIVTYAVAGGSVWYGLRENRLKKRAIAHLEERARRAELALDERRSSSQLTTRGETNPSDQGDI